MNTTLTCLCLAAAACLGAASVMLVRGMPSDDGPDDEPVPLPAPESLISRQPLATLALSCRTVP